MATSGETAAAIAAATARDRALIAARGGGSMNQPEDQLGALLDLVQALDVAGIPYALIGGIAVGIHSGSPRATADVDIAAPSTVGRDLIADALAAADFEERGRFAHSLNFRHTNGEPVQIAIDPAFDPMIERAEVVTVASTSIRIVGKEDLLVMKQRAAEDPARRPSKALRDRADVELLRGDVPEPDEGW